MSKNSIKIAVSTPCNANLDDMQTVGNGKFCTHCSKTVWDFTNWSEEELGHFFSNAKEPVCGKFLDFQLNKPLPSIPFPRHYGKIAAAALGFSLFFTQDVFAQNRPPIQSAKKLSIKKIAPKKVLIGTIKNNAGVVMPSVAVKIVDSNKIAYEVYTDRDGCFEVNFPDDKKEYGISIQSPRFSLYSKKLNELDFKSPLHINLQEQEEKKVTIRLGGGVRIQGGGSAGYYNNDELVLTPLIQVDLNRPPLRINANPIFDESDIKKAGSIDAILKDHPFLQNGR